MKIESKAKGIELLNKAIPYPDQMKNFDLDKDGVIYFDWRSSRYRLELDYCYVMKVEGHTLAGDDASILMAQCIKKQLLSEI